ncbi:MAG: Myo-inositol 2-dehydrogenase 2 (EC [uncultured Sulfurovum sp.]|uniref:Myo-inositol 2-dehydrogenase 2 (EC) n=1 Tax=uncultured Sulfurovum sp. TaxID=269237 RepID=A0A6S6RUK5_9BACT|nr:MAG: Myo-inositol 2-dehydrogenase 2 (EC [uncultured Sulfurovum sp.]
MKYINFKGDRLAKLSLGTVQFGLNYGIANNEGQPTQKTVNGIIDYVYTQNINCFDTAQAYGNSEEVLGISLKEKQKSLIMSKLKSNLFREDFDKSISKSLANLQTNSLYALLLHDSDLLYNWLEEDTLIVNKLIKSGKIKYFGVSIYTSEDFQLAIENNNIKVIQIPFNLFDQRAIREQWFKKAKESNKLIVIRSVFLQGLLLMDIEKIPNNLLSAKKFIKDIDSLSNELNLSKNELALNFVDSIAKDALILFGCDNLNQAKENIVNYTKMESFDEITLSIISEKFTGIDENIYNPAKW